MEHFQIRQAVRRVAIKPVLARVEPAPRKLRRGETLYHEGDEARFVYEILEGSVILFKYLPDGRRQIVDFIRDGGFCGLSIDAAHSSSCECVEGAVIQAIPRATANMASRERLLLALQSDVCRLQDRTMTLGRKDAVERVATFLIETAFRGRACGKINDACPPITAVHVPIARRDMADFLGLSTETVCRALSNLKSLRLIAAGHRPGDFLIADVCGLCRRSQGQAEAA